MDFVTLADLLYASGVAAGGIGLCAFAFTSGGLGRALLELADAIRAKATSDHLAAENEALHDYIRQAYAGPKRIRREQP